MTRNGLVMLTGCVLLLANGPAIAQSRNGPRVVIPRVTAAESGIISCWIRTNEYKNNPNGFNRRAMQYTCGRAKRNTKREVAQGRPPFGGKMPKYYQGKPEYRSPSLSWFFK